MAQVTDGSDFDNDWEERTNVCLALVREAADAVSRLGANTLTSESIVASFLWVLSATLPPNAFLPGKPRLPLRFFDRSSQPKPSGIESCERLQAGQKTPDCHEAVAALESVVSSAMEAWAMGDPEKPDTRTVLQQLLGVLWSRHMCQHPPSRQYPRGI